MGGFSKLLAATVRADPVLLGKFGDGTKIWFDGEKLSSLSVNRENVGWF